MILYHGSNVEIDRIDLSKSNVGKDFGVGFYLTPNRDHALGQAQRKIEIFSFGVFGMIFCHKNKNKYPYDLIFLEKNAKKHPFA